MVKSIITVPFISSDPLVGKVTFPLKVIVWIVYLTLLSMIIAGIVKSFIQVDESSKGFSFLLLYMAISFGFFSMIVSSFLDKYIYEHIVLDDRHLIYKYSKILSGNEKRYKVGPDSKIVWSIEIIKINYMEARYNQLIFYDVENKMNILIKKFSIGRFQERSWIKFVNDLCEVTNLKVEKEEIQT